MAARVKNIFGGQIRNRKCPKAVGVYHHSDMVSLRPWFVSRIGFKFFLTQVSFIYHVLCLAS
jgi:hypothetical protein